MKSWIKKVGYGLILRSKHNFFCMFGIIKLMVKIRILYGCFKILVEWGVSAIVFK
jgi:hypothetical protein